MSKTLKLTVSFPMTIVVNTETVLEFKADRKELRELPAEKLAVLKGRAKANAEMMLSDRTDDQIFEIVYRAGLREFLNRDLKNELTGSDGHARIGDIKVVFEAPMVPRSCNHCIRTECSRPEGKANAGCEDKLTGVREACGGPRWTETV